MLNAAQAGNIKIQIMVPRNSPSAWTWVLNSSLLPAAFSNADSSVTLKRYQENSLICNVTDQEIQKTGIGNLGYQILH